MIEKIIFEDRGGTSYRADTWRSVQRGFSSAEIEVRVTRLKDNRVMWVSESSILATVDNISINEFLELEYEK